jgi:hypothetical protein
VVIWYIFGKFNQEKSGSPAIRVSGKSEEFETGFLWIIVTRNSTRF